MPMSRRCIPYTPRRKELRETVFALVTTAGVHLRDQQPFDLAGDNTWRLIPGDVHADQLMVTHGHYDHRHSDSAVLPSCDAGSATRLPASGRSNIQTTRTTARYF